MAAEPTSEVQLSHRTGQPLGFLSSPWLWGGLLTCLFYQAIPYSGTWRPFWERYFCAHPIEYAQAGLFFVGASILAIKALQLLTERQAVAIPLPGSPEPLDAAGAAAAVREALARLSPRLRRTIQMTRLADLADYLACRRDAAGVDEHARQLADAAESRQLESYSQLQTIIWAIPIFGFLGTVIGITLAIANVTPEQLDTSLNQVTGGLAVAFDTTATALTQSVLMVFAAYFVKRADNEIHSEVDERTFKEFVSPLSGAAQPASPMLEAETQAASQLLSRTESLINHHAELWREAIESLRSRWTRTLDDQQQELATALSGGVQATLGDHESLLRDVRGEFAAACQQFSTEAARQLAESRVSHSAQQEELRRAWSEAWRQVQEGLERDRAQRAEQSRQWLDGFAEQVSASTRQLAEATAALQSQMGEASRQTELLTRIVGQEEQLTSLQERLTENLDVLRAAETMQQTLNSLNAAIHLLTARTRPAAA